MAELVAETRCVGRGHHERGAVGEGHPDLLDGAVEAQREALVDPIVVPGAAHLVEGVDEEAHVSMLGHDPFGAAGRARGVDDVSEVRRRHPRLGARHPGRRDIRTPHGVVDREDAVRAEHLCGPGVQIPVRQAQPQVQLGGDVTDAVRRIAGVDRDVSSACFQAGKDADDRKLRSAREYPDERSRSST